MQEKLEAGAELMPDRLEPERLEESEPVAQPSQHTPIRKVSRNRGRQSRKANGSDEEVGESDDGENGRRHSKRPRTLAEQF